MTRTRITAVIAALMVVFVACGDDDLEPDASSAATATAIASSAPCNVDNADLELKESNREVPFAPLSDVRTSGDECARIAFEFQDGLPGYAVEYVEPPFRDCGEGRAVEVSSWDAGAYLTILLEPTASADQNDPAAPMTYTGPRDFEPDGPVLKHMKITCDYEAQIRWLVGVDERRDFHVYALEDPPRIVVDLK